MDTIESLADRLASLPGGAPTLREVGWHYLMAILVKYGRDRKAAARVLGVSYRTIYYHLHQIESERPSILMHYSDREAKVSS